MHEDVKCRNTELWDCDSGISLGNTNWDTPLNGHATPNSASDAILLMFYDDYIEGRLSNDDFAEIIKLTETLLMRRTRARILNKNDLKDSRRQKLKEETGQ